LLLDWKYNCILERVVNNPCLQSITLLFFITGNPALQLLRPTRNHDQSWSFIKACVWYQHWCKETTMLVWPKAITSLVTIPTLTVLEVIPGIYTYLILRKILNSHLFWLNSHPFFARPIICRLNLSVSVVNQGTTRELARRSNWTDKGTYF